MNKSIAVLICPALMTVAACGPASQGDASSADDFAARINGEAQSSTQPAPIDEATPQPTPTPTIAAPLPIASQEAVSEGAATDPNSSACGANLMGGFIGKPADEATRAAVKVAASGKATDVRFVPPDGEIVQPDPANPRLNLMIDNLGVIRDARCG